MKKILLLGILMLLIVGCNSLPTTPTVAATDEEYTCEEYGYGITIPEGWILAEAPECLIGIIAERDYFLNVVVNVEPTDKSLAEVFTEELERMERSELYVNTEILNTESNSIEFKYFMGEETHADMELFVENGYVYTVTYQSYEEDFAEHEAEMAAITDTFTIF